VQGAFGVAPEDGWPWLFVSLLPAIDPPPPRSSGESRHFSDRRRFPVQNCDSLALFASSQTWLEAISTRTAKVV
jgi:hypothetical protein